MSNGCEEIINISQEAKNYLYGLKKLDPYNIYLRIAVKQGGCSGLSYLMSFEDKKNIEETDQVIDYKDFQVVCDSKSLLYLYGISLGYKSDLVGGGFYFSNPNANQTCGCGKSFST